MNRESHASIDNAIELNLPSFDARMKSVEGVMSVFDVLRKKYVALTPEEWVRQSFVNYLLSAKGYRRELMNNEVQLSLNGMSRRCDTVVWDMNLRPAMIVEYKAPDVEITQKVFDQIQRYNQVLQVRYLVVTNGMTHYCCRVDYVTRTCEFLSEIPDWTALNQG
ncbi:MAG: type I restriction enzyme HsdR N-terminal domain-containing protein [Bacteroidaceae bacterium]|nr:type I restriction enzyme HsdR N-terminal domain-containing protein [Bacteroidaceae bacterium]